MGRFATLARTLLLLAPSSLVVTTLALAGCSEDGEILPGSEPIAFDQYCERYAQMTCDVAQRCNCLDGIGVELCRTYQRAECSDEVEEPVRAGRNAYDEVQAGRCLSELEAIISDCSLDDAYWPPACDDMLVGQVPIGGICEGDSDCQGTMECHNEVCTVMPRDGEPCLDESTCASEHFCSDDGRCLRYRGRGGPCPEGGVACDDDLYCDARSTTCEPYLAPGQGCAHDTSACDDDLYCSPSAQVCTPYPGPGQSCADSSGDCADDLYCDSAQVCQAQLPGGAQCTDDEQCRSWDCPAGQCTPDTDGDCPFL